MKTSKLNRSSIFSTAWAIFKTAKLNISSFSTALKMAWKKFKIKAALLSNEAFDFTYRKLNGDVRHACGTLNANVLPTASNSTSSTTHKYLLKYYDLEKQAWRSCRVDLLF